MLPIWNEIDDKVWTSYLFHLVDFSNLDLIRMVITRST